MEIFKKTPTIQFMKYKYVALIITAVIVLAGVLNVAVGRGLKLGVDFGSGTLIRIGFVRATSISDIRQKLSDVGLGTSVIQETGKRNGREFQIRSFESGTIGAGATQDIESHERLADQVIATLRGEDGKAERAAGLSDLNSIEERALAGILETSFAGKGEELAKAIVGYRISPDGGNGIIGDFSELSGAGIGTDVIDVLKTKTFLGKIAVISRDTVSPQAGKDLRRKAVQATIWSLLGMLIYIAVRFKLAYGVAAIFTLAQDVLITMSVYSFTNREINLPIIAGILTIVGFSINDTIVIFDRVRENQKLMRGKPLEEVMNVAINQCLGRTIITSGTVFLTVAALFFFGGDVINDFAFLMLVGTIEGVYSTIYLSCPVVLFWQKWFGTKKGARR
jgi:preprotein translocase subunit SecF